MVAFSNEFEIREKAHRVERTDQISNHIQIVLFFFLHHLLGDRNLLLSGLVFESQLLFINIGSQKKLSGSLSKLRELVQSELLV